MTLMEEETRSSESAGEAVKKKIDGCSDVAVGSSSVSRDVSNATTKEKKRARLIDRGGSGLSDNDEQSEPKVRKLVSGTTSNGNEFNDSDDDADDDDEDENVRKTSNGKSRLGVFEFDEYDDAFDGKNSKRDIVYKRKHSCFDRANSYMNKRVQGINGVLKGTVNNKKKGSGVLKTYDHSEVGLRSKDTVKTKELARPSLYAEQKVHSKVSSSVGGERSKSKLRKSRPTKNNKAQEWISDDSDTSLKLGQKKLNSNKTSVAKVSKAQDWISDDSDTSLKVGQKKLNSSKTSAAKVSKAVDSDSDNSDASLKVTPKKREAHKPLKSVRSKGEITPLSKMISPTSEGKVKRGSGTEKQVLRDKIKKMLLDAGWTIDYRPRRNRNYQDAVYINPSGSAYWSIIKAYDAFQKQAGEEDGDGDLKPSGDSEIADLVLNKLTRQTGKKIEKEMRRKRRDANSSTNKRPKASDKKGRVTKIALNDSDTESQSEDNYTSDDNCNVNLGKGRKLGRCTLVVRGTNTAKDSQADDYIPYTGKRTLLSWLIDWGIVGLKENVQYIKNHKERKVLLEGWITRGGIHCGCCSKILTVSKFEIHAGSKLRQPYQNTYLESGVSLLQCQMDAWNKQEESERSGFNSVHVDDDDPNDDTCGICGDGGDLICCDGCPSTFHQACLGMKILPIGDWNCSNCVCKFCGMASINPDANNMTGCDLPTCSLCERKYHKSCIQDVDVDDLRVDSTSLSFCGKKCREMFESLQKLVGVKHELEGGFSWSVVHRTDTADSNASVKDFPHNVECNSKVAVALTVMDECFLPIVDRRSGINIIHNVLYNFGSNFSRLKFCGFYTAILERGDEIISAASLRFHGPELAEMPFIGTRHIYRRQGMCNRLYRAIESALCSLTVEKLIIPAISELVHTWTEVFGFDYLEVARKEELRSINMLVFPGIDMLQKILKKDDNSHPNVKAITAAKSIIHVDQASLMAEDKLNETDEDSLAEHDNIAASDSVNSEDTLNDVPVPTFNESHAVQISVSNDERNSKSRPKYKVSESETETKSILSSSGGEEDIEMKDNIIQDSLVTGDVEEKPSEDVLISKGNGDLLVKENNSMEDSLEVSSSIEGNAGVLVTENSSIPSSLVDGDINPCKELTEVAVKEHDLIPESQADTDGDTRPSEDDRQDTSNVQNKDNSRVESLVDDLSNCTETAALPESKDNSFEAMRDTMVHDAIKLSEQVLHSDNTTDKCVEIIEAVCANNPTEGISETVSVKV